MSLRLIPDVSPLTLTHRQELEAELEREKRRFKNAVTRGAQATREELALGTLVRKHPIPFGLAALAGGLLMTYLFSRRPAVAQSMLAKGRLTV